MNALIGRTDVYAITSEDSAMQKDVEAHQPAVIGSECIYDFRLIDPNNTLSFWVCSLCNTASKNLPSVLHHLSGVKHCVNYVNEFHPNLKPVLSDVKLYVQEVKAVVHKIMKVKGVQKIKVALLKPEAMQVISAIMKSNEAEPAISETAKSVTMELDQADVEAALERSSELANKRPNPPTPTCSMQRLPVATSAVITQAQLNPESSKPKSLASSEDQHLLWCEECYLVICVDTSRWSVESAWSQHVRRPYHTKKWNARKLLQFDEAFFVDEISSLQKVVESQRSLGQIIVGLDDMVERITVLDNGQEQRALICLLCCEVFAPSELLKHSANKIHLYQFIHRQFPEKVKQLFFDRAGQHSTANSQQRDALVEKFISSQRDLSVGRIKVYREKPTAVSASKSQTPMNILATQTTKQNASGDSANKNAVAMKGKESGKVVPQPVVAPARPTAADKSQPKVRENESALVQQRANAVKHVGPSSNVENSTKKGDCPKALTASTKQDSIKSGLSGGKTTYSAVKNIHPPMQVNSASGSVTTKQNSAALISKKNIEKPATVKDPLLELLNTKAAVPFSSGSRAYVHRLLADCSEPLIGVDHVCEVCCTDAAFEPAYLCKLCATRSLPGQVVTHLVSENHRLKYLEMNYKHYHQSVVQRYSNQAGRAAVIKQYAAMIEREEGRKMILRLNASADHNLIRSEKKRHNFPGIVSKVAVSAPSSTDLSAHLATPSRRANDSAVTDPRQSSWEQQTSSFLRKLDTQGLPSTANVVNSDHSKTAVKKSANANPKVTKRSHPADSASQSRSSKRRRSVSPAQRSVSQRRSRSRSRSGHRRSRSRSATDKRSSQQRRSKRSSSPKMQSAAQNTKPVSSEVKKADRTSSNLKSTAAAAKPSISTTTTLAKRTPKEYHDWDAVATTSSELSFASNCRQPLTTATASATAPIMSVSVEPKITEIFSFLSSFKNQPSSLFPASACTLAINNIAKQGGGIESACVETASLLGNKGNIEEFLLKSLLEERERKRKQEELIRMLQTHLQQASSNAHAHSARGSEEIPPEATLFVDQSAKTQRSTYLRSSTGASLGFGRNDGELVVEAANNVLESQQTQAELAGQLEQQRNQWKQRFASSLRASDTGNAEAPSTHAWQSLAAAKFKADLQQLAKANTVKAETGGDVTCNRESQTQKLMAKFSESRGNALLQQPRPAAGQNTNKSFAFLK